MHTNMEKEELQGWKTETDGAILEFISKYEDYLTSKKLLIKDKADEILN